MRPARSLRSLMGRNALRAGAYAARTRFALRLWGARFARLQLTPTAIGSLIFWTAAFGAVYASSPRRQSSFEIDAPSALVGRTICAERATVTIGAPTPERGASHGRWSSGAFADAAQARTPHACVRDVLLDRARAHVPRTLRRTYDAHAPPRAIDRV